MVSPFDSLKVLCWRDKIEEILEGKIPSPVAVEIDASNLCTQSCDWCMFKDFKIRERRNLEQKILFKLIGDLAQMQVKALTFTGGGEPLINPSTPEAMLLAKRLGMQVGLVTNGDLLEEREIIEAVIESCRYVRLSIDAGKDETHYRLKHPRFTDQLSRNLKSAHVLMSKGFTGDVGIAFLIHPDNYLELPLLIQRLEELGVSYLHVRPCLGVEIDSEAINYSRDVIDSYRGKLQIYANFKRFDEIRFGMKFEKCRATPLLGIVGADAKMYLCCQFRGNNNYVIGDLKKASFKEQWGSPKHTQVMECVDIKKCPPCRYSNFNQLIEDVFLKDKMHKNFI